MEKIGENCMDEKNQNGNRRQSNGSRTVWGLAIYLLALVLINISKSGIGSRAVFGVVVTFAIAIAAVTIVAKQSLTAIAKKKEGEKNPSFSSRPAERKTAVQRPPVRENYSKPNVDPPKAVPVRVYSESIREENESRDRQRRLRQLDDFYKNGIIDKDEYRILRQRYEKY